MFIKPVKKIGVLTLSVLVSASVAFPYYASNIDSDNAANDYEFSQEIDIQDTADNIPLYEAEAPYEGVNNEFEMPTEETAVDLSDYFYIHNEESLQDNTDLLDDGSSESTAIYETSDEIIDMGFTDPSGDSEETNDEFEVSSATLLYSSSGGEYGTCYGEQLHSQAKIIYDEMVSNWSWKTPSDLQVTFSEPLVLYPSEEVTEEYLNLKKYLQEPSYETDVKEYVRRYIQSASDAYAYDHPESFWYSYVGYGYYKPVFVDDENGQRFLFSRIKVAVSGSSGKYEKFEGAQDAIPSFETQVRQAAAELEEKTAGMSMAMKAKAVHDWVNQHSQYYDEGPSSHTAFNAFFSGNVVCEGYSKAFKILYDMLGGESAIIVGNANTGSSTESHMWNNVKIDGLWYILDATWDDSGNLGITKYLLTGSDEPGLFERKAGEERIVANRFSNSPYTMSFAIPNATATMYHEWILDRTVEKECEQDGMNYYKCQLHNDEKEELLKATGHVLTDWHIKEEPKCTVPGLKVRECENCDYKESAEIEPAGHSWGNWYTELPPTCIKPGIKSRVCTECSEKESEPLDTVNHNWGEWKTTKESSCTETGIETKTCIICQKTESRDIPVKEHSWSDWTVTQKATCGKEGTETRTCKNCKKAEIMSIPKTTEHKYEWKTITQPTISKEGYEVYKCTVCGKESDSRSKPRLTPTPTPKPRIQDTNIEIQDTVKFTGDPIKKFPVITYKGKRLEKNVDYTLAFSNNIYPGTAKVTITGINGFSGTVTKTYTIVRKSIEKAAICGVGKNRRWTGSPITHNIRVKIGGRTLVQGVDYTVSYRNNINVGQASVTVTGKGNYTGSVTRLYKINPVGIEIVRLKVNDSENKITVSYEKQKVQTRGYQVQICTDKNFKSGWKVTYTTTNRDKAWKTFTGLEKNTTYYFRVRTYSKVDDVKYYSKWSTVGSTKLS